MKPDHQVPTNHHAIELATQRELTQLREQVRTLQSHEARLLQSEDRYRQVVENLGEGMIVIQDDRVVFANTKTSDIFRIPREQVLGSQPVEWLHPQDRAAVADRIRRRQAGETVSVHNEFRRIDNDGSLRWIDSHSIAVPWEGRSATMSFFSDVTERKAMTEALQRSEERYRAVIEHVGEGMIIVQGASVVFANRRAAAIFRVPAEELISRGFIRHVSPEDQPMVLERQKLRVAGHRVPDRYELRLSHADHSVTWLELGVTLLPWDGKPATLIFFSDINHRKNLETQLLTTLKEREAILNSTLVGISFNRNRHIEWVNDKYIEMTGFTRDKLVGASSRILYDSDAEHQLDGQKTMEALIQDGTYMDERLIKRHNGEPFWVVLSGRCVVDRNPAAGVIWTMLDITERRQADENMRMAFQRQTELNELRSRFVSMTSHEFRTPLATILSCAELLRYYDSRMSEDERTNTLINIEAAVHRMTRMLERVLVIGKSDAQMLEYQPTELNLDSLCKILVSEAVSQTGESTNRVIYEFSSPVTTGLYDEKLLRHVFSNLLSNALKYSPSGGSVRFLVHLSQGKTVMEVSDSGIGIPSVEIPHLFESFHRASNVGTIPGTGLGLSIVKKSVELHGGTIEVASELGVGTRFTVIL